ncbi:hypothetical protein GIB67_005647 [Kingdonia uniflora]|uniref:GTD-binding domain-containing protein n=1 Tax=Kingdonia uniflora TaxID=39325 RepID=A0A7J7NHP8_9MAGN|nr:hypothetical protein GIB67_005647 [Kingdonia uniflora]
MELGYEVWMFGYLAGFGKLLLLVFAFLLGLMAVQLGYHYKGLLLFIEGFRWKSAYPKNGFCSVFEFVDVSYSKILSFKDGCCRFLENPGPPFIKKDVGNMISTNENVEEEEEEEEEEDDYDEEEMDILALKKTIWIERERANDTYLELQKERMASADAAEEAMAMILRLQNEKSSIELQAHQYRKIAEQKQLYDQEVIHSLRWITMEHESERNILESQLKVCRKRLKNNMKGEKELDLLEDTDQRYNYFCRSVEDDYKGGFISSLEMESLLL